MHILVYILLFVLSLAIELGISMKAIEGFQTGLIKKGYKVSIKVIIELLLEKKKNILNSILSLIPGINIVQCYIMIKSRLKRLKTNPKFIANLESLTIVDQIMIKDALSNKGLLGFVERLITYSSISDKTKMDDKKIDIGEYSKKELKNNDLEVTKEVINKMYNLDEEKNDSNIEGSFYTLPGEYNLSSVLLIDENAKFIKTPNNSLIAIVNTSDDEIFEFIKKGFLVKPSLEEKYHTISLTPFDKNKIRKSLFEIETRKIDATKVIDAKKFKIKKANKGKERVL